jgi:hypothetical protein
MILANVEVKRRERKKKLEFMWGREKRKEIGGERMREREEDRNISRRCRKAIRENQYMWGKTDKKTIGCFCVSANKSIRLCQSSSKDLWQRASK